MDRRRHRSHTAQLVAVAHGGGSTPGLLLWLEAAAFGVSAATTAALSLMPIPAAGGPPPLLHRTALETGGLGAAVHAIHLSIFLRRGGVLETAPGPG
jgi:hypothetical protein